MQPRQNAGNAECASSIPSPGFSPAAPGLRTRRLKCRQREPSSPSLHGFRALCRMPSPARLLLWPCCHPPPGRRMPEASSPRCCPRPVRRMPAEVSRHRRRPPRRRMPRARLPHRRRPPVCRRPAACSPGCCLPRGCRRTAARLPRRSPWPNRGVPRPRPRTASKAPPCLTPPRSPGLRTREPSAPGQRAMRRLCRSVSRWHQPPCSRSLCRSLCR